MAPCSGELSWPAGEKMTGPDAATEAGEPLLNLPGSKLRAAYEHGSQSSLRAPSNVSHDSWQHAVLRPCRETLLFQNPIPQEFPHFCL